MTEEVKSVLLITNVVGGRGVVFISGFTDYNATSFLNSMLTLLAKFISFFLCI